MKRSNQTEKHAETPHPRTLWAWHYLREMAHIWGIHRGMIEKRGWGCGKDENKYKTETHTLTWRPSGPFLQHQVQSRRWLQKTGREPYHSYTLYTLINITWESGAGRYLHPQTPKINNKMAGVVSFRGDN